MPWLKNIHSTEKSERKRREEKEKEWLRGGTFSNEKWKIGIWLLLTAFVAVIYYSCCYCSCCCYWKLMWQHIWVLTLNRMPYYPFEYLFIDYVLNNEYTINLGNLVNSVNGYENSAGSLSSSKYLLIASNQKKICKALCA